MSDQWRNSTHVPKELADSPEEGDYCIRKGSHCRTIYLVKRIWCERDQWYRFYMCELQPIFPRWHQHQKVKLLELQRLTPLEVLAVSSL